MSKRSARTAALVLGLALGALAVPEAAHAQTPRPPGEPATGPGGVPLPPLPDSLRLYGGTLATGATLPLFEAPPGAVALTLAEAVEVALLRNPGRAISALEAVRARNDVTLGAAGFLPTLDATAGARGTQAGTLSLGGAGGGVADTLGGGGFGGRGTTSASTGLALGYTLFDGFRRDATYRRLQADARRFALLADADAEALALAVTSAYLDLTRQVGLVAALSEAVTLSEDRLRITAAEVRIGTSAEINAALALADLNADRANLLRQRLALAGARATLGGLLALPDPEAVTAAEPLALGPPLRLVSAAALSLAENRQLRALDIAERGAEELLREVRAEFLPVIRASAGVGLAAFGTGVPPPQPSLNLQPDLSYGITASLPIFDGGERRRRVQTAQIRLRQAELATADEGAALRADVARLVAEAQGFRALVELETQNEAIARQNVRVALAQFQLGFTTPLELRQVQLVLTDAQTRRVDAVFQTRRAEAELQFLSGSLLPEDAALAAP